MTKQKFVLDENVVIFAEKLTNAQGHFDALSLKVITDILVNCHAIAVDELLDEKYRGILDRMESEDRGVSGPTVTRMLAQIRSNSSKFLMAPPPPQLNDEDRIPKEDRPLVRLVAAVHGILVTRDEELARRIDSSNLETEYGFQVLDPEATIALLAI